MEASPVPTHPPAKTIEEDSPQAKPPATNQDSPPPGTKDHPRELVDKYKPPPSKRCDKLTLNDIIDFVFPKNFQHPQATGRLFALGMYGPLDEQNLLRSGVKGEHIVQTWELDSVCQQFEKEDIIQTYIPFGRPVSTLTHAEMQEIVSQADAKMKTAKGKAWTTQVAKGEIYDMFKDLPKDNKNRLSFHDVQRRIMQYRIDRINKFKVMYPNLVKQDKKGDEERNKLQKLDAMRYTDISKSGKGKLAFKSLKSYRVSSQIAPPTMFEKNEGLRDMEIANHVGKLLSHHTFKICHLSDVNSLALTQNVRLIRSSEQPKDNRWDGAVLLKRSQVGSHVKCARSSTAVQRKTTIY